MRYKRDAIKDLMCVVAYGTLEARNVAINLLVSHLDCPLCGRPFARTSSRDIYETKHVLLCNCRSITGPITTRLCMIGETLVSNSVVGVENTKFQLKPNNFIYTFNWFNWCTLLSNTGYKVPSCVSILRESFLRSFYSFFCWIAFVEEWNVFRS